MANELPQLRNLHHRAHALSFVDKHVPVSDGGLRLLLKSTAASNINLRALVDMLFDELNATEFVMTNPTNFALVNVFSTFTNFSYGICEPPPDSRCYGSSAHVHFTFAISERRGYKRTSKILNIRRRNLVRSVWSVNDGRPQFVTISIPAIDINSKYGIAQMFGREMEFLYVLVGSLLKTQIASNATEQRYAELPRLADKYLNLSIHNAIEHYPMPALKYVAEVWKYLPSLVEVDDLIAVYYFAYIRGLPSILLQSKAEMKIKAQIESILAGGILAFIQAAKQDMSDVSSIRCLLVSSLISQLVSSGDNKLELDAKTLLGWQDELKISHFNLIQRMRENEVEPSQFLMPNTTVAKQLFAGNIQFANRLLALIG